VRSCGEKSGEKTRYIVLHRGLTETTEDCQWRLKMSHLWRPKMSHFGGGDEPQVLVLAS
jgi:hypothetical protein